VKLRFVYLIKFLLLGLSVYFASYLIFLSWNILEWPVWYRSVLAVAFVLGVAGYIASDDNEDEGYSRKFWKDNLSIITAYANGEEINFQPKENPDWWYATEEEHLFKSDYKYKVITPATTDIKKNSTQQDNRDTAGEQQ